MIKVFHLDLTPLIFDKRLNDLGFNLITDPKLKDVEQAIELSCYKLVAIIHTNDLDSAFSKTIESSDYWELHKHDNTLWKSKRGSLTGDIFNLDGQFYLLDNEGFTSLNLPITV